jgi:hypothetical protein
MEYIPKIHDGYVEMMVEYEKCPICNKVMIQRLVGYDNRLFPAWIQMTQEAQAKRAGIVFKGSVKVDDDLICEECEKSGRADFLCAICNTRQSTDEIQESFGYPPEFLCKECYNTVPAKTWDEKVSELHEAHRYDYD